MSKYAPFLLGDNTPNNIYRVGSQITQPQGQDPLKKHSLQLS